MAYDGSTWDETQPTQSTIANTIDSVTRDVKIGTRSRLANEHNWPSSQSSTASGGQHLFISLQQQTGTPIFPIVGTTTQDGVLFSSSALGLCYATYNTGAFNVVQLVGTGQKLNITGAVYSATGTIGDLLIGQTGTSHAFKVLVAPTISSGSGSYVLTSNGTTGDPTWNATIGLGTWASKSDNTPYQAATDGFVIATSTQLNGGGTISVSIYTDASATPTTLRACSSMHIDAGDTKQVSAMCPVKKGDYYKTVGAATIYFIPLGN